VVGDRVGCVAGLPGAWLIGVGFGVGCGPTEGEEVGEFVNCVGPRVVGVAVVGATTG